MVSHCTSGLNLYIAEEDTPQTLITKIYLGLKYYFNV